MSNPVVSRLLALHSNNMFSNIDGELLTKIAERVVSTETITQKQLAYVQSRLVYYAEKLVDLDCSKYDIPVRILGSPSPQKKNQPRVCRLIDQNTLRLDFGYNTELIAKIKAIPGRRYYRNETELYWTVPNTVENIQNLQSLGFSVPTLAAPKNAPQKARLVAPRLLRKLRKYQKQGAERLAGEMGLRGLLADEMGLGKTAQALAAVEYRKHDAYPVLVVCPSSLKWNWAREAKMWLPDVCVRVISGYCKRSTWRAKEREICIINDDILAHKTNKYGEIQNNGWMPLLASAGYKTLIVDECHRVKNNKKKQAIFIDKQTGEEKKMKVPACKKSAAVLTLAKATEYFIALSGTPIENRPVEFFPVLNALDERLFPNFWQYAQRYCGASHTGWGWNFNGASNTQELHIILTQSLMIRRKKQDVLKELPPKVRTVVPVEIDLRAYHKEEKEFLSYIQRLKNEEAVDIKESKSEGLARIERLKQAAVVGKLKACVEWIEDYLESDKKLVVFATHKFVLDDLQKHFPKISVRMDGSTAPKERQAVVDAFQNNPQIRLFLGNIKAAGVGITLTAASDTLTLELGWTPGEHDQAEDRTHRIGQDADSVNAYYLIAKDTIEEEIADVLDKKREVLCSVMDGQDVEDDALLTVLLEKYKNKTEEEE